MKNSKKLRIKKRSIGTTKKKKGWEILEWIILIALLLGILYYYLKPYKEIEYYPESDGNKQIREIGTRCNVPSISYYFFYPTLCGDAFSYYKNGQIKEYMHPHIRDYDYISYRQDGYDYILYYEDGQKKIECKFERIGDGEDRYAYASSLEPCVFYDENGQIYKRYGKGEIEKKVIRDYKPKIGYMSGTALEVERIIYFTEKRDIEKIEYYKLGYDDYSSSAFLRNLIERDTATSDGIKKEYYLEDGDLGLIEYYDKEGRLYETYDNKF